MAVLFSSLVQDFEDGTILVYILEFVWTCVMTFIRECFAWMCWMFVTIMRLWFCQIFWPVCTTILFPFVYLSKFVLQFFWSVYFSGNNQKVGRNSVQSYRRERRQLLHNYKYFSYWYLSIYFQTPLNSTYGTFNNVYATYPWWYPFLVSTHIPAGDINKFHIASSPYISTSCFFARLHNFFASTSSPPPDGYITQVFILLLVLLYASWAIFRSLCRIFWLRCTHLFTSSINFCPALLTNCRYFLFPSSRPVLQDFQSSQMAFTSVFTSYGLTSDKLDQHRDFSNFDSDTETALVDNCANTHVWNVREHFSNFRLIPTQDQGVSTIGGQPHFALGVGDVATSWKDDNGDIFHHTLKDVLYFPD